ncbi:MAG: acylphosphatase [Xanthomonadales bacterium]|nr:acylphosphatase [Xanthomonadales bacterium]
MTPPPLAARFLVEGRVQGVFYRVWTQAQAQELSLRGWVRNLPDGRVEACAVGAAADLDELERRLHQGPPSARVAKVQREPVALAEGAGSDADADDAATGEDFRIRH